MSDRICPSSSHGRAEAIEAKPAAALPVDAFGDAALLAFDDFVQARDAMRDRVLAQLNADVTPPHLVRDRRRCARAEEGIEDEIAGGGGDVEDAME